MEKGINIVIDNMLLMYTSEEFIQIVKIAEDKFEKQCGFSMPDGKITNVLVKNMFHQCVEDAFKETDTYKSFKLAHNMGFRWEIKQ